MTSQVQSFAATPRNLAFLKLAKNKSELVNKALDSYRKIKLYQELQEGFNSQDDSDVALANIGMEDYLKIIEDAEK